MTYRTTIGLAVLFAPALALAADPPDPDVVASDQGEIDTEIAKMKTDLAEVRRGYDVQLRPEVGRVERRLREGEIHFLLNDYLRASIVLIDAVEDPANKSHPRYDDCVFLLAEALRKSKNYSGARRYYEEILPRSSGDRLKDVVLGLLQIAGDTNRFEDVDRYISRLRQAGSLSRPDVDYIYGKMLFRSSGSDPQQLGRALEVFRGVPAGSSISGQASYYGGVVLVKMGRYEEALSQFTATKERASTSKDADRLMDLAALSLGRLHQELGNVAKAADAYQGISRNSPYFPEMLYEVSWAHVTSANLAPNDEERDAAYTRALRATELLMATSPDSRLYPEARILQGNLQIRLGASETAYDTFQSIVDRYGGARDRIGALMRENDPKQFFDELVAADLDDVSSTSILPPLALSWALEENDMERAVGMQRDLAESDKFMQEARDLIATLDLALKGEQRFNMVPGLKGARSKAISIENRVINTKRRLVALERRIVEPYADASAAQRIAEANKRTQELEKEIRELPQNEEQVEASRVELRESYLAAGRRAYKLAFRVSSMRAQLVAVDAWLRDNKDRVNKDEQKLMVERMERAQSQIEGYERELATLQGEIRRSADLVEADAGLTRTKQLRAEYDSAVSDEIALLRTLRSRVGGDLQGALARLEQQRTAVDSVDSELRQLQEGLERTVADEVASVKKSIAVEASKLANYEVEHGQLAGETSRLLGPVASQTLVAVGKQFNDLVLKADVGIIDVAWARKQAETKKVNELIREQQERQNELENEFEDVLRE